MLTYPRLMQELIKQETGLASFLLNEGIRPITYSINHIGKFSLVVHEKERDSILTVLRQSNRISDVRVSNWNITGVYKHD